MKSISYQGNDPFHRCESSMKNKRNPHNTSKSLSLWKTIYTVFMFINNTSDFVCNVQRISWLLPKSILVFFLTQIPIHGKCCVYNENAPPSYILILKIEIIQTDNSNDVPNQIVWRSSPSGQTLSQFVKVYKQAIFECWTK